MALAVLIIGSCGGGNGGTDAGLDPDAIAVDAPTGNSTLAALTVSAGVLSPPFEPEVTEYHLDLVLDEADVVFTPTAAVSAGISILVDSEAVTSGAGSQTLALSPGSRDVDIVVAAPGGAATTYQLHVHRGVDALASLDLSTGSLSPVFDSANRSYAVQYLTATSSVAVTPTLLVPERATLTVNGADVASGSASDAFSLAIGENAVTVGVSPATRPARSTVVDVLRGTDYTYVALSYAGGELPDRLIPAFDPDTTSYAVDVGLWVQELRVSVTPVDATISATVAGFAVAPGVPSAPIALPLGLTTIPIVLTDADSIQRTYDLAVTRGSQVLQRAYTKASNTGANDSLGSSVSLYGETLVVGVPGEDSAATGIDGDQGDNSSGAAGAVYVFTRSGGTWSQQAYLKASNTNAGDKFGSSVALWGDILAVGAVGEASAATGVDGNQADNSSNNAGAVYVFTRSSGTWSQQAYLKASNTGTNDYFGTSVALWGDTLGVGAIGEASAATGVGGDQSDDSVGSAGAVYIFTRAGEAWSQQAYLKAALHTGNDEFGTSVTLWGDTLAVGAPLEDSASNAEEVDSGAVYVFTRTGTAWSQQADFKGSCSCSNMTEPNFGISIALWGDTLAVGADLDDHRNNTGEEGAVHVFTRSSGIWSRQQKLEASNFGLGDNFGNAVALFGDTLAVGAEREDSAATGLDGDQSNDNAGDSGAAYVFRRSSGIWSQLYVKASNASANDYFGGAVALWGDTLAVGAVGDDSAATGVGGNQADNSAGGSGAVYIFR